MARIPLSQNKSGQVSSPFRPTVRPIAPIRGRVQAPVPIGDTSGLRALEQATGQVADVLIAKRNQQIAEDERNFLISEDLRINKILTEGTRNHAKTRGEESFNSQQGLDNEIKDIKPSKEISPDVQAKFNQILETRRQQHSNARFSHEADQRKVLEDANVAGVIEDVSFQAETTDNGTVAQADTSIEDGLSKVLALRGIKDTKANARVVDNIRLSLSNSYYNSLLNRKENETADGTNMATFFEANRDEMAKSMTPNAFATWEDKANSMKDSINFNAVDSFLTTSASELTRGESPTTRNKIFIITQNFPSLVQQFGRDTMTKVLQSYNSLIRAEENNQREIDRVKNNDTYSNVADVLAGAKVVTTDTMSEINGIINKSELNGTDKIAMRRRMQSAIGGGLKTDPAVFKELISKVSIGSITTKELSENIGQGLSISDWQRLQNLHTSILNSSSPGIKQFNAGVAGVVSFAKANKVKISDANQVLRELDKSDVLDEVNRFMEEKHITDIEDPKVIEHLRVLKESKNQPAWWSFIPLRGGDVSPSKTGQLEQSVKELEASRNQTTEPSADEQKIRKEFSGESEEKIQKILDNPASKARVLEAIDEKQQAKGK